MSRLYLDATSPSKPYILFLRACVCACEAVRVRCEEIARGRAEEGREEEGREEEGRAEEGREEAGREEEGERERKRAMVPMPHMTHAQV